MTEHTVVLSSVNEVVDYIKRCSWDTEAEGQTPFSAQLRNGKLLQGSRSRSKDDWVTTLLLGSHAQTDTAPLRTFVKELLDEDYPFITSRGEWNILWSCGLMSLAQAMPEISHGQR